MGEALGWSQCPVPAHPISRALQAPNWSSPQPWLPQRRDQRGLTPTLALTLPLTWAAVPTQMAWVPLLQSCSQLGGPSNPVPNKALAPDLFLAGTWPQLTKSPCPQKVSLQCPHPRPRPVLSLSRTWLSRGTRRSGHLSAGSHSELIVGTELPWQEEGCLSLQHL